jgi:hypothetical protein
MHVKMINKEDHVCFYPRTCAWAHHLSNMCVCAVFFFEAIVVQVKCTMCMCTRWPRAPEVTYACMCYCKAPFDQRKCLTIWPYRDSASFSHSSPPCATSPSKLFLLAPSLAVQCSCFSGSLNRVRAALDSACARETVHVTGSLICV